MTSTLLLREPFIFFAPNYFELNGEPLIFLNGPIQGAPDWQMQAIKIFESSPRSRLHIASPRRPDIHIKGDFGENRFNEQIDWELHYRAYAHQWGVNLFWFAKEEIHYCERGYAQTTRGELGMSLMLRAERRGSEPAKMVVGFESEYVKTQKDPFPGERYWRRAIQKLAPEVKVFNSLQETIAEAINLAK